VTAHDLRGQVAIVTGGGSGIGRAIAVSLATGGVRCALVGRRAEKLDSTLSTLATPGIAVVADITDHQTHARVLDETRNAFGPANILVHAAGRFENQPIEDTTDELWDGILAVNVTALMALTRTAWPTLVSTSGQIVLISSIATTQHFEGDAAYAASKAGVDALGQVLALEGNKHGIRVITINPAQTDTDLWDGKAPPEVRARMMTSSAVGELTAALVAIDRGVDFSPVRIRPTQDPWKAGD
jgi:NAD(P)-dependent dehydrogenase (short-subunit alcohol dehydrogenase family)